MVHERFLPEGALIHTEENIMHASSVEALCRAMENETILEGVATLCDTEHNLFVDFCGIRGVIPYRETALGIADGNTREIAVISRVGKPVSFVIDGIEEKGGVPYLKLSRRKAQQKALAYLFTNHVPGDVIPVRVTHLEPFGAFVDIGCGVISLIGIETLSVSRIPHPSERFCIGDEIFAVITGSDIENCRIFLSHRELLGTWEENVSRFRVGETVCGVVRGVESYGIFVELAPNLSGLAESRADVSVGDSVSVFIKSILIEKMKIKLVIIDTFPNTHNRRITKADYFITDGHMDMWRYSPEECSKKEIFTSF